MFKKYLFIICILGTIYATDKIYTEHFNNFDIKNLDPHTLEINFSIET